MCFDKRNVKTTSEMFDAIIDHIKFSYNSGNIRPAITIFRKREIGRNDFRVWNTLMAHFAGYRSTRIINCDEDHNDASTSKPIGDQGNLEFTEVIYHNPLLYVYHIAYNFCINLILCVMMNFFII